MFILNFLQLDIEYQVMESWHLLNLIYLIYLPSI